MIVIMIAVVSIVAICFKEDGGIVPVSNLNGRHVASGLPGTSSNGQLLYW